MLVLSGNPFTQGRLKYSDRCSDNPEPTAKIYVQVGVGDSTDVILAQLDTGAPWSVLAPDMARKIGIVADDGDPARLSTRFGMKEGFLVRVPFRLIAEEGETLTKSGTFFISPDWPEGLSFLGYTGLLDSIRFAFDPPKNHFYFGEI